MQAGINPIMMTGICVFRSLPRAGGDQSYISTMRDQGDLDLDDFAIPTSLAVPRGRGRPIVSIAT